MDTPSALITEKLRLEQPRPQVRGNLQHIDEIRFLVIHLILINHWASNIGLVRDKVNPSLIYSGIEMTSPCLSMISGYLFFFKTKFKFNFPKKIKSRISSLVIPYLFWSLSFFVIYFVIKETFLTLFHSSFWYVPPKPMTFANAIATIVNPPLLNFWYLQNLILILPFNFVIFYLLRYKYLYFAVLAAIIIMYSFNLGYLYFSPRFLPYYMLGCYFGYNELYVPKIPLNKWMSFLLVLLLFYIGFESSNATYFGLLTILRKLLIVVFFLVSFFNLLDSNQRSWIFAYLQKYKPYSFFLFAINMFLFTLVQRGLFKLGIADYLHNKYSALLFCIGSALVVLVLALSIAKFIKSKWPRFYLFITGR